MRMKRDRNKNKYIVRQPIRNAQKQTIGYEILYHGENQAFGGLMNDKEFAAADTVYTFLIQNTDKLLKGSFYFMTFTATLLLKKTPDLFDRSELVIQIDDSVIIHPEALTAVKEYAAKGYRIAVNEFQFLPRYLAILDTIDYLKLNFAAMSEEKLKNIIEIAHRLKSCASPSTSTRRSCTPRLRNWAWTPWRAPAWPRSWPPKSTTAAICKAISSA